MIFSIASMRIKAVLPLGNVPRSRYFLSVKKDYGSKPGRGHDFELIVKNKAVPSGDIPFNPWAIPKIINPDPDTTVIFQNLSICRISWKQKRAVVSFSELLDQPEGLFFDYVKILFSFLLIEKGGLPIHSSAVVQNNNGLVFYGPSGAGKTTIAELLRPSWRLLNDDVNFILPCRGHFKVYSTPFVTPGKYNRMSKGSARLRGVFLLRKHSGNSVSRLALKRQILSLSSAMFTLPFADKFCQKMLENIENLCRHVPVRELFFKNDHLIAKNITAIMELAHGNYDKSRAFDPENRRGNICF
jgi:hypothetical protein